jgi:hypothetical protein
MFELKTLALFVATAVAEIVGCYLPYLWLEKGASAWLLLPAAEALHYLCGCSRCIPLQLGVSMPHTVACTSASRLSGFGRLMLYARRRGIGSVSRFASPAWASLCLLRAMPNYSLNPDRSPAALARRPLGAG